MEFARKRPGDFESEDGLSLAPRKRFKAAELPLTQVQRTSIESILHSFKKKGEFDVLRKKVFAQFQSSNAKSDLLQSLTNLAESELERNPSLMAKDRKQAAPLIEGAVERSEVYKSAETDIDRIIDGIVAEAEEKLRDIRKAEVGEANATEEQIKGSKSDEDYIQESIARRQEWERAREEENEKQRQRDIDEERRREEERKLKQAEEDEKEKQREVEREEQRKRQEAWERELEERRERKKRQDAEWERERIEKEELARKRREAEREKEIEAAALEELLRESKSSATKPIRGEDVKLKDSGTKESALEAIMKAEKLERERAKNAGSAGEATDISEHIKDAPLSTHRSFQETNHSKEHYHSNNSWARDGHRPADATNRRGSLENAEKQFNSDKHGRPLYGDDPIAREESLKNNSMPREERTVDRNYQGSIENLGERNTDRSSSHGIPDRKSSVTDRLDHRYYKSSKESHHSSYHDERRGRSRSPLNRGSYRNGGFDAQIDSNRESRRRQEPSRSRSPHCRYHSTYRERDSKDYHMRSLSRTHRRSRSRDPKDIDRYVPPSSYHDKTHERTYERYAKERGLESDYTSAKDSDRNRRAYERHRDAGHDKHRHRSPGQERDRRRESAREKDRDYRRSVSRDRDRTRERDGGKAQDRESETAAAPVQIDRYMPPTSYRAQRGELDAPAHARTHVLAGSQKVTRRSNNSADGSSRSRSRSPKKGRARVPDGDEEESRSRSRQRRR